jgi:hypothetical protein
VEQVVMNEAAKEIEREVVILITVSKPKEWS